MMKEFEVVYTYLNGCAGAAYPQKTVEEVEAESADAYIRAKHSVDYDKFTKETDGDTTVYRYDNGTVTYIYELTEI